MSEQKVLPLGSVVLLKEGMQKLVIIGRGAVYIDQDTKDEILADYIAVLYPAGLNPDATVFFNHDKIDKIIHKGYSDSEESRFLEIYHTWKNDRTKLVNV